MRGRIAVAVFLAGVLSGCADSGDVLSSDGPDSVETTAAGGTDEQTPTEDTPTEETPTEETPTEETPSDGGTSEEALIEQTLITYDLAGGCELLTDKFLAEQTFIEGDREAACEVLNSYFVEKQYDADDIVVSDVQITGDQATAVFGSTIAPDFTITFQLVKVDGTWLIDGYEL